MEWQNKRTPTDRTLEDRVDRTVEHVGIFRKMLDVESDLDALVQRKRLDHQDMIGRSMRKNKTLRLFVSSNFVDQPWQMGSPVYVNGDKPHWFLRVEGRLLDDDSKTPRAFSSMITSVIVELRKADEDAMTDNNTEPSGAEIVEWHEASVPMEQRVEFDGLDVKRPGSDNVNARILIQLKEYPDKFTLSPALAKVIGVTEESKPGAVVALWQYIRYHKLQDVDEKRLVKCDAVLQSLFNTDKIMLPRLVELLTPHLSPRSPITIDYEIRPTQDLGNRDIAFDVPIQIDHSSRGDLITMLNAWPQCTASINRYENLILKNVQALNSLAYQHDFYDSFSRDPIEFLDKWVESQSRDLKTIYSDQQFSEEAVRHSSFYTDELINPSLHLFLGKN